MMLKKFEDLPQNIKDELPKKQPLWIIVIFGVAIIVGLYYLFITKNRSSLDGRAIGESLKGMIKL